VDDGSLRTIIGLKLGQIGRRLQESQHVPLTFSEELVSEIVRRCTEVESGARNVDHILTGTLLPEISSEMLSRMVTGEPLSKVNVTAEPGHGFQYEIA
jgi:type VI secretion system protein VasG